MKSEPGHGFRTQVRQDLMQNKMPAESARSPSCPNIAHAENIRRNLKKMAQLLTPGDDRDSQLIDLVNHIDTIAQQIERGK